MGKGERWLRPSSVKMITSLVHMIKLFVMGESWIANEEPNQLESLQCISRRLRYPLNHFFQQSRFSFLEDSGEDPLKINEINFFFFQSPYQI